MNFSFSTTAGASQGTTTKRLEGNAIHSVKFDGCEILDIQGSKDPTATYKIIKLKFSNENGVFEHAVFEPREDDFKRVERPYTDKKTGEQKTIPQASNVESMMLLFKHAIDTIYPPIGAAIDNGTQTLGAPNWDALRKLVSQILDKGKDKEPFEIKLITNSKGDPVFPGFFAAINREGKAYVRNNFIGKNLAFTANEAERIHNMNTAKPTQMSTVTQGATTNIEVSKPEVQNTGIDFDLDLASL